MVENCQCTIYPNKCVLSVPESRSLLSLFLSGDGQVLLFSRKKTQKPISGQSMGNWESDWAYMCQLGLSAEPVCFAEELKRCAVSNEKSRSFQVGEMCMLSVLFLTATPVQKKREWEFSWLVVHEIS